VFIEFGHVALVEVIVRQVQVTQAQIIKRDVQHLNESAQSLITHAIVGEIQFKKA
jgi:hypothetical protein